MTRWSFKFGHIDLLMAPGIFWEDNCALMTDQNFGLRQGNVDFIDKRVLEGN